MAYDDDVDGVMMRDDIVPRALTSMRARRASIFAVSTSNARRGLCKCLIFTNNAPSTRELLPHVARRT